MSKFNPGDEVQWTKSPTGILGVFVASKPFGRAEIRLFSGRTLRILEKDIRKVK